MWLLVDGIGWNIYFDCVHTPLQYLSSRPIIIKEHKESKHECSCNQKELAIEDVEFRVSFYLWNWDETEKQSVSSIINVTQNLDLKYTKSQVTMWFITCEYYGLEIYI